MEKNMANENLIKNFRNSQGFTLIEILIALTLLALAGTFVVGKFYENLNEGQISSTKIQLSNLDARLKEFRRKCGFYPTAEQGLDALLTKPTSGRECKDYPPGGFIDGEMPKDPWNNDFVYESDGKEYNIYSYGQDGEAGGEGVDGDIYLKTGKGGAPKATKDSDGETSGGGGSPE